MQKFEVNFFEHDSIISFEQEITQTINPVPIKTIGEISILPGEGDRKVPAALAGQLVNPYNNSSGTLTCVVSDDDAVASRVYPVGDAQIAATAYQAQLDEIDYENSDVGIHISGKDLEIDIDNSIRLRDDFTKKSVDLTIIESGIERRIIKTSDGTYVSRVGTDSSTDIVIDPSDAGIQSPESLITNVIPICNPRILMDMGMWYKEKSGEVDARSDDRHYVVKEYRQSKLRWWESIIGRIGNGYDDIYSIDYDDYLSFVEQLERRLLPSGITMEIQEYRNDYLPEITADANLDVSDTVESDVRVFMYQRPGKFPTSVDSFEIAPTDMTARELMRRLFDPEDEYDRRDIKSRDIYTNAISNAVDNISDPPVNVGDDEYLVLSEDEYNLRYRDLYNQLAYIAFPVKFGIQDVTTTVCDGGEEVTKKIRTDIGTKIVSILFIDTQKLTAFRKEDVVDIDSTSSVTTSSVQTVKTLVECKIPALPSDSVLRKMGFDIYGSVNKAGADVIFPYDSSEILSLDVSVRNKFDFLIKMLRNEFGNDRVKLITTTISVEKFKNTVSDTSTFLSWHNFGFAARIVIFDSSNEAIVDGSDEYMHLLEIAKIFIEGCSAGLFGPSAVVVWGSQINVNPDPFEWEILPPGYAHGDICAYRESILNLVNPVTLSTMTPCTIEEFLFLMNTKFDAYGTELVDIQCDTIISTPVGSLSGDISYISNAGTSVTLGVGEYVELKNQLDDSLNDVWEIMDGEWSLGDVYIKWKDDNPISYHQLLTYYAMIGDYSAVRALLAIEYVDMFRGIDQALDAETYLSNVLKSSDGLYNFFNGILNDGSVELGDAIKATSVLSPASFFMVDDRKIKTPLFEIKLTAHDVVTYSCEVVEGSAKLTPTGGSFSGIEIGDTVAGKGIPIGTVVENVYDIDLIKLSSAGDVSGIFDLEFAPSNLASSVNMHGQYEINPINMPRYMSGEYSSTNAEFLSESDRTDILCTIKSEFISYLDDVKSLYTDSGIKFLFDSFENGSNADDEIFLENDFGIINVQRIVNIDMLVNMYNGEYIAVPEMIYDPDTARKSEELLNIFEETVSIARGVRISTLGREKPKIEPLEEDRDLKKELTDAYAKVDSKFDVSDF